MSDRHEPSAEEQGQDEEQRLFALLDRYVETLHAENPQTRSELLAQHGELAGLLECLDALETLAPPRGSADPAGSATAEPRDEGSEAALQPTPFDFGRYELAEEIGRGGMGVVYRARQKDLDRTVALKMILSSHLASREQVERFYAEARAAAGIRHANVVGIHEVGQLHGQHYFTMDFVEGPSLAEIVADGPVEPETAARLVSEVARAVDFLHRRGIVHRDLKPSNILLDDEGTPYVTDFGLAKVFSGPAPHTRTGTIVGTPSYMAPEQAAGRTSEISPRSDVYSLGAILYELLTGRPPFREQTPLDTLAGVLEGEPTLPRAVNARIPRELELICLRCLEKNPAARYESAAALAEDLQRHLAGEAVDARPASPVHKLRRWARRAPALASHLAALGTAAAIVQVNYLLDPGEATYHYRIMGIFGLWAALSFAFQWLLRFERTAGTARFAWCAADPLLLTTLLAVTAGSLGTVLVGYPLLIAASGLFFQVRLVWFMTTACLVSYAALLVVRPGEADPVHYPLIFAAALAVTGFVVAYQVYRVRVLSRFYDRRQLP